MNPDLIDAFIKVRTEDVLGVTLPSQIDIILTSSDLEQINYFRQRLQKLSLSKELLADFRYYSLAQRETRLASPLTFTTYYVQQQTKVTVIKSVITLEGKIEQQICRSWLQNTSLLNNLIASHYWLITQLCDRLNLKYNQKSVLLTWVLSLTIVLILTPLLFYFLPLSWLIKLVICLVIFLLLNLAVGLLISKLFPRWILQNLLFGFLAQNTSKRRIGFMLLRYFV